MQAKNNGGKQLKLMENFSSGVKYDISKKKKKWEFGFIDIESLATKQPGKRNSFPDKHVSDIIMFSLPKSSISHELRFKTENVTERGV